MGKDIKKKAKIFNKKVQINIKESLNQLNNHTNMVDFQVTGRSQYEKETEEIGRLQDPEFDYYALNRDEITGEWFKLDNTEEVFAFDGKKSKFKYQKKPKCKSI